MSNPPVRLTARLSKQGLEIGEAHIPPDMVSRDFTITGHGDSKRLTVTLFCSTVEVDEALADEIQGETL